MSSISSVTLEPFSYSRCHIAVTPPRDDHGDFLRYNPDGTRTFSVHDQDATLLVSGTATGPFYSGVGKLTLRQTQRPISGRWEVIDTDVQATACVSNSEVGWRAICSVRFSSPG